MAFQYCPQCRGYRMHGEGKCNICGYISSTRESLYYLYGAEKTSKNNTIKKTGHGRSTSNYNSSSNSNGEVVSTIVTSSILFSDSGSFGSDGGSSGDCF